MDNLPPGYVEEDCVHDESFLKEDLEGGLYCTVCTPDIEEPADFSGSTDTFGFANDR